MSAETKYKCDVCKTEIKLDRFSQGIAFALKWAGTGMKRDILVNQTCGPHRDAPIHLCFTCIDAIANLRKELK